jgi:hypothetical protein
MGRGRLKPHSNLPRGRPPIHQEAWIKVSVVLFERQVVQLDRLTAEMRRKSGKAMTRAQIIRALIDGLISSGMDVTVHASESTLRAHIAQCLDPASRRRPGS